MTATTAVLRGLGSWVPPRTVDNEEIARQLGVTDDWIFQRSGIRRRHICDDDTATSDLAVEAGARALSSAGCSEVDAVVLATATPDYPIPGTAPVVASRLGLTGAAAFDVAAVCSGFIYALAVGSGLISARVAGSVLVIGADCFSKVVDPQDKTVRPLFGDGAGAVVLTAGQESEFGALGGFDLGSDGTQDALFRLPGGGTRARAAGGPSGDYVEMDGRGLFVNAVSAMASSSRAVLAATGRGPGDVDRVVGHQANLRILKMVAGQLNLPEDRLVSNIDRVANTSAASIPLALADGIDSGAVVEGHTVLLTAFGAGLTWGSTVMIWPKILVNGGEQ